MVDNGKAYTNVAKALQRLDAKAREMGGVLGGTTEIETHWKSDTEGTIKVSVSFHFRAEDLEKYTAQFFGQDQ
jgi:hypothetical protein